MKIGSPDQAVAMVEGLQQERLFAKGNGNTDFASLGECLMRASSGGEELQPTIITSVGGEEAVPTVAAGFNVIPAMELARRLVEGGYEPSVIITSAGQYAVESNGFDEDEVMRNWAATAAIYEGLLADHFPDLAGRVQFESLEPDTRDYPPEVEAAIREAAMGDGSLWGKARSMGNDTDDFSEYMASHIQAFRDFQVDPEARFVIKVGAQSEVRFSRFQKAAIELCMPGIVELGFVPNVVRPGEPYYGQVTLYYPRIGSRPPYYPETDDDPAFESVGSVSYDDLVDSLSEGARIRYGNLAKALAKTSITPDQYLDTVRRTADDIPLLPDSRRQ